MRALKSTATTLLFLAFVFFARCFTRCQTTSTCNLSPFNPVETKRPHEVASPHLRLTRLCRQIPFVSVQRLGLRTLIKLYRLCRRQAGFSSNSSLAAKRPNWLQRPKIKLSARGLGDRLEIGSAYQFQRHMKKTPQPAPCRLLRQISIATLALTLMASGAQAQHFYDHDRQWHNGGITPQGTVPEDYMRPVMVDGDVTRSTPPFGYSVSAASSPAAADVQSAGNFYYRPIRSTSHIKPHHDPGGTSTLWITATGRFDADDAAAFRNAEAALGIVSSIPPPVEHAENHRARQTYYCLPGQSGSLIQGGSGTAYTMPGRGQY